MRYLLSIAFFLFLTVFSCQKEIIVPNELGANEIVDTRSSRNPEGCDGDNNSVTDPDGETEDDKVKSKKRKVN